MSSQTSYISPTVPFSLPMMVLFSVVNHHNGTIAHALDFDLVSAAATEEEAVSKLRLAVKQHIEFGLKHNLQHEIILPAPKKFWNAALIPDSSLHIGEPIEIDHHSITTVCHTTSDELEYSLSAA